MEKDMKLLRSVYLKLTFWNTNPSQKKCYKQIVAIIELPG